MSIIATKIRRKCLSLKKVDSSNELKMEKYFSAKRERYQETVLNLYFKEGKSVGQISRILPLSPETIRRWCITFASGNEKAFIQMKRTKKIVPEVPVGTDGTKSKDLKELQAEIKRLQRDLRMEKLRADLNEEIIKVAESKFNIHIRKKAGAKQ